MKSISNTKLALGLVEAPVQIFSSYEDTDIKFHLCGPDGETVEQKYKLPDGTLLDNSECEKAYEGVVIGREAIDRVNAEAVGNLKRIAIQEFIPLSSIPFSRAGKRYYIASHPTDGSIVAFTAIARAMKRRHAAGICKVVLKGRQVIMALFVDEETNVMNGVTLTFAANVRAPDDRMVLPARSELTIDPRFTKAANDLVDALMNKDSTLIDTMEDTLNPKRLELIERVKGGERIDSPKKTKERIVGNDELMAALEASVAAVRVRQPA